MKAFYFVGKYGSVGHDERNAGITFEAGYPVFSTYDEANEEQRHNNARFVSEADAIEWSAFKNR